MRNPIPFILTLVAGGGLLLATAGPASAHERDYRQVVTYVYAGHRVQYRRQYPYWLRTHAGFDRWYRLNHHRYSQRLAWPRLYAHYQRDDRYHRKYHGKRKYDRGYQRRHRRHH